MLPTQWGSSSRLLRRAAQRHCGRARESFAALSSGARGDVRLTRQRRVLPDIMDPGENNADRRFHPGTRSEDRSASASRDRLSHARNALKSHGCSTRLDLLHIHGHRFIDYESHGPCDHIRTWLVWVAAKCASGKRPFRAAQAAGRNATPASASPWLRVEIAGYCDDCGAEKDAGGSSH